ncbi:MAG: Fe-S cluster assembly protein SufD [Arenicella sp.]|jgi:Fe-S cluster assembly protein SufD
MSIAAENTENWLAAYADQQLMGESLPWLLEQRRHAQTRFEEIGLPGVRDEKWRYTNLRALKSNLYQLASKGSKSKMQLPQATGARLVFVDGYLDAEQSNVPTVSGLAFMSLDTALATASEDPVLENNFGACLPDETHGFTALNTAYCQDGYVVKLDNNAVVEGVLEVYFIASQADTLSHTRNLIIAGTNSQCTVVERHVGSDGSMYLNNSITEIIAGDGAHIDHYKIQQESNDAFHIGGVFINQAANSNVKTHNVALSGLVTRNDTNCSLLGQGGHIEMNGLVLGKGRQHVDNHTEVNHAEPNCTSDEYYKTILDDSSRSVFRGRIIVAQDAQLTNADQQNNNLLLSKQAEADSKPQLEIYADDVKCSHGVTVGQLDPNSMFYLQSRGIDKASARALLTFAFANEVIQRIRVGSVREEITQIIAGQLLSGLEELL